MQRGKRGVDAAHPGLLDDEEEAAEGLAGVEEEGGRVVDDEDVDELELLPALASLRKTRMKKAGTSDWPADTQRRGAGPGRRAGSMMSATKTSESRDVEHELLERTATVGGCCGRGCSGACWGDGETQTWPRRRRLASWRRTTAAGRCRRAAARGRERRESCRGTGRR
jgi:hypothetical protein